MEEQQFENTLFHHASWNVAGLDSSEALDLNLLLTKRRVEIGGFKLLEWNSGYALFAKLEGENTTTSPGYLVQYEITVGEKVRIDCHMESQSGSFHPFDPSTEKASKFRRMVNNIKRRDQECGRALRSRSAILKSLQCEPGEKNREDYRTNIKRILTYSSPIHRKLRVFHSTKANTILVEMTCSLLLSGSLFGVSSSRLPTSTSAEPVSDDNGLWFLVTYDRETMSLLNLSLADKEEEDRQYRELTLFTSTIGDLYTKRDDLADDVADDESVQTHSDHACVSQFVYNLEEAYAKIFSTSAYLALRECSDEDRAAMNGEDFQEAVNTCVFVEVSNVLVVGSSLVARTSSCGESKLLQLIKTVLCPVPGDSPYFFYNGTPTTNSISEDDDYIILEPNNESNVVSSHSEASHSEQLNPPIFVRLKLDGEIATASSLNLISKSSVLAVEVSLFPCTPQENSSMFLPLEHQLFAREISMLLKSFVAEQTLERLLGATMSEDNLNLVRKCLDLSKTTMILCIDVFFFSSKKDSMESASGHAGGETSFDVSYGLFESELLSIGQLELRKGSEGDFFVSCTSREANPEFWTRIRQDKMNGKIVCQVYHPDGVETARLLSDQLDGLLQSCLHRTNQRLLLRR
jgi:hypothetical protein